MTWEQIKEKTRADLGVNTYDARQIVECFREKYHGKPTEILAWKVFREENGRLNISYQVMAPTLKQVSFEYKNAHDRKHQRLMIVRGLGMVESERTTLDNGEVFYHLSFQGAEYTGQPHSVPQVALAHAVYGLKKALGKVRKK